MLSLPLDHAAIAALVPHAGAMCLLDGVQSCTDDGIVCTAISHRDPAHPLRRDGMLPAICGVEYALQAMALHGALTGDGDAQPAGYLASLRGLLLATDRLDDVAGPLEIRAVAEAREARSFIYAFEIGCGVAAGAAFDTGAFDTGAFGTGALGTGAFDTGGAGRLLLSGRAAIILPEVSL